MRVFVTGSGGQLGYDLVRELERRGADVCAPRSKALDICDRGEVLAALRAFRPDAVLHCAAYTKVDRAESEPALCRRVNADGTRHLAEGCAMLGAKMLYVSTDYVFPGRGTAPYEIWDAPEPLNEYGRSKLAGEAALRELVERSFVVRSSWVIGQHGGNFVKTMLRLASQRRELRVVSDQIGSPSFTADLAPLLCDMIETDRFGLYHATNEGFCSWAELAEETFRAAKADAAVRRISTEEFGAPAPRPKNSRLSKASLDENGFSRLPLWQDSLSRLLSAREHWSD